LPRGTGAKAVALIGGPIGADDCGNLLFQFLADRTQQHLARYGFLQDLLDAQLSRSSFELRKAGSGDHDRRHRAAALSQLRNEIETVQARHPVVDDHAHDVWIISEKIGTGKIRKYVETIGFQQDTRRITYCGIVIDDGYHWALGVHRPRPEVNVQVAMESAMNNNISVANALA
jgi:hypothetical protein